MMNVSRFTGRLNSQDLVDRQWLVCPSCREFLTLSLENNQNFRCPACEHEYLGRNGIVSLLPQSEDSVKKDIQVFWGELYGAIYAEEDTKRAAEELNAQMPSLEELFFHRKHLAAVEMDLRNLSGKTVLEIGSGAGAHSALFRWHGAHVISTDITLSRVAATAQKLQMIKGCGDYCCLQADAERLPFADNLFDVVYSNGVLHHTPDTDRCVQEVYRVLKPGGVAVIMLYAKHSFYYWCTIFFLKGLVLGNWFRYSNWLGRVTEWMTSIPQSQVNPETKVYSAKDIRYLFRSFSSFAIRKNSFQIQQLPVLGRRLSLALGRWCGKNSAGILLYGHPWRKETSWELAIGRWMGFCFNIKAVK